MRFEVRRRYNKPIDKNMPSWMRSTMFGTCMWSDDFMAVIKTDAGAYHLVEQSKCDVEWKRTFE